MRVEVFSDVVCPWCYIGKRRLEQALTSFPHADEVTVTYRSYQLDPSAPRASTQTITEHLSARYGIPPAEAAAMNERVTGIAATVGLDLRLEHAHPTNTFDAHRLLHFAAAHGRQVALNERLFSAHFVRGESVGDTDALVAMAVEVGLDALAARAVLDGGDFAAEVGADIGLAAALGVRGVPFFVIDRRFGISGAQDVSVLTGALTTAWAERGRMRPRDGNDDGPGATPDPTSTASGSACSDGVCAV